MGLMGEGTSENVSVGIMGFATTGRGEGSQARDKDLLRAFTAISKALNLAQPLPATLDLIAEKVSQMMGHKYCAVLLANKATKELLIEGSFGLSAKYVREVNTGLKQLIDGDEPRGRSVTAQAYRTRMPVYAADITADPRFEAWQEAALEVGYKSIVALPLIFRDEVIGVLNCYDEPRRYSEDQVEALMVVAEQAASAVGIARLLEGQRSTIQELNALNEHVVAQHALLEHSEKTHEALAALLLEDRSLDDITETLSGLLEAPVALQDEKLRVLSRAAPDGEGYEGLPSGEPGLARLDSLLSESKKTRRARATEISSEGSPKRTLLIAPVDLGGHGSGYLTVALTGEANGDFFLRTLEQASTVYALYMTRQRVARETEERIKGDLLAGLVTARPRDEAEARERAHHLGIDFSLGPVRVLVVCHEPLPGYFERKGRSLAAAGQARGKLLALTRGFVGGAGTSMAGTSGNRLVALLPCRHDDPHRPAKELLRLLENELPDLRVRVGVIGPCAGPETLAERYEETARLVDLAEFLGATDRVICHDDWKIYGLLLHGREKGELLDLAQRVLDPLLAQEDGRGDLMTTLQAYLDNDLSPARTARALHVHHNTVKYRMKRISDLLSLDLDGLDGALTAKVALMLRSLDPAGFDSTPRAKPLSE